jgi:hypothetical protein
MIVKLAPHPDQIRYWAQSALNAFTTLDMETAVEIAKAELEAILAYLDRTDNAETVLGIVPVETGIRDEAGVGQAERSKAPHLEIVRP